jgi:hypothetical protein
MGTLRSFCGRSTSRAWRPLLAVALVAIAVLAAVGAGGLQMTDLLTVLPALALAVVMLTRPYLGERVIARLRMRRARAATGARLGRTCTRSRRAIARGGRLIATALAGRAPPAALASCR